MVLPKFQRKFFVGDYLVVTLLCRIPGLIKQSGY